MYAFLQDLCSGLGVESASSVLDLRGDMQLGDSAVGTTMESTWQCIRPGARVMVRPAVTEPIYGWKGVRHGMVGLVHRIEDNGEVVVHFGADGILNMLWRGGTAEVQVVSGRAGTWPGRGDLQCGRAVRVLESVAELSANWGKARPRCVGYLRAFSEGRYVVDFPEAEGWRGYACDLQVDAVADRVRPGTRVRVRRSVATPKYGWGAIGPDSEGVVQYCHYDGSRVCVDFPGAPCWHALLAELEPVDDGGDYNQRWDVPSRMSSCTGPTAPFAPGEVGVFQGLWTATGTPLNGRLCRVMRMHSASGRYHVAPLLGNSEGDTVAVQPACLRRPVRLLNYGTIVKLQRMPGTGLFPAGKHLARVVGFNVRSGLYRVHFQDRNSCVDVYPQQLQVVQGGAADAMTQQTADREQASESSSQSGPSTATGGGGRAGKWRGGVFEEAVFICPITQDVMQDPVVAEDGHTYEQQAIRHWLCTGNCSSPMTSQPMGPRLVPNHLLRSMIGTYNVQQGS